MRLKGHVIYYAVRDDEEMYLLIFQLFWCGKRCKGARLIHRSAKGHEGQLCQFKMLQPKRNANDGYAEHKPKSQMLYCQRQTGYEQP